MNFLVVVYPWKMITELSSKRSKTCNIDSLKDADNTIVNKKEYLQYLHNSFTRMSQLPSVTPINTTTDMKLPRKSQTVVRKIWQSEVLSCDMGFQLKVSKQHPCTASKSS